MKKIVEIDPSAGFCFGVDKAIELAENRLMQGEKVYGLGEMVHNDIEISRLEQKGLETIRVSDFASITPAKVILRAHGEPPETYKEAARYNIEIIDATCPIVKKLQKKIGKVYRELDPEKEQIVIYGKEDHPETIGLMGQTEGSALLITDPDDLNNVDRDKSIFLFSQTTMDPSQFQRLENNLMEIARVQGNTELKSSCSICNQMKRRKPDLKRFAEKHETVIFVSGKRSANGAMLYTYCKDQNRKTYWISSETEIEKEWLSGEGSIGISGATSTPQWQLEKVRTHILNNLLK